MDVKHKIYASVSLLAVVFVLQRGRKIKDSIKRAEKLEVGIHVDVNRSERTMLLILFFVMF
jgi:hypothetical protein